MSASQTAAGKPGWGGFIATAVGSVLAAAAIVAGANVASIDFAKDWVNEKIDNSTNQIRMQLDLRTGEALERIGDVSRSLEPIASDIAAIKFQQEIESRRSGEVSKQLIALNHDLRFQAEVLAAAGKLGISAQVVGDNIFFVSKGAMLAALVSRKISGSPDKLAAWTTTTEEDVSEVHNNLVAALDGKAIVLQTTAAGAPKVWDGEVPSGWLVIQN